MESLVKTGRGSKAWTNSLTKADDATAVNVEHHFKPKKEMY